MIPLHFTPWSGAYRLKRCSMFQYNIYIKIPFNIAQFSRETLTYAVRKSGQSEISGKPLGEAEVIIANRKKE